MLLNDKVLFRMQWPQYADLQVNGMLAIFIYRTVFSIPVELNGNPCLMLRRNLLSSIKMFFQLR